MINYNVELKKYISKILRDILLVNDIDFEISECNDLTHFEISCNDEQHKIIEEFLQQYNYILDNSQLYDNDLKCILVDYDFDFIYNSIYNGDYMIYDISNLENFGGEIFELYNDKPLNDYLARFFDYEKYALDYLDNIEYVDIEYDRIFVIF